MTTNTTSENIINLMDSFFKEKGFAINVTVLVPTVPISAWIRQEFCAREKGVNSQVKMFHFLFHGENLTSKRLLDDLKIVMKEVVKVVNSIKGR